jgi:hypothetical protein
MNVAIVKSSTSPTDVSRAGRSTRLSRTRAPHSAAVQTRRRHTFRLCSRWKAFSYMSWIELVTVTAPAIRMSCVMTVPASNDAVDDLNSPLTMVEAR